MNIPFTVRTKNACIDSGVLWKLPVMIILTAGIMRITAGKINMQTIKYQYDISLQTVILLTDITSQNGKQRNKKPRFIDRIRITAAIIN